jgi:hypothetical protein
MAAMLLTADGRLLAEAMSRPPTDGKSDLVYHPDVGIAAGRYVIGQLLPGWGMPDDQRLDEGLSLVYSSDPLSDDLELIGAPIARLSLSSTAPMAFVSVKLCDVAPDGTSVLVTKGVLNLTHRNSHEQPEPLTPGEIYGIRVPMLAAAYRFLAGHRLRLMIAAADFQNAWPTPLPHTLSVYYGTAVSGACLSQLELPLAGQRDALPTPIFQPSEFPPLPPEQIPTPQYTVTRDLIKQTMAVNIETQSGIGVNHSHYTVSITRPSEATVRAEYEYPLDRPGMAIRVRAQCVTRSDALAFHHLTEVSIELNGRPYWRKNWSVSVPRNGC